MSSLNTLSTQSSTGISEYKEYLRTPLDNEKQKALEADIGEALGISNPAICKILAAKFRDYKLKDIQKFDEDKMKPTYAFTDPVKPPGMEKANNYVGHVGADVLTDLGYLAGWNGADDEAWPFV